LPKSRATVSYRLAPWSRTLTSQSPTMWPSCSAHQSIGDGVWQRLWGHASEREKLHAKDSLPDGITTRRRGAESNSLPGSRRSPAEAIWGWKRLSYLT
jgi:hypothetical protein